MPLNFREDFARIIRVGYLMDRSRYLELLKELLGALEEKSDGTRRECLYMSREHGSLRYLFSLIEETGLLLFEMIFAVALGPSASR